MSDKDLNTEQKILNAARVVFVKKGMDGTRMQAIADEAGINKALLHYYFRSKDKLFQAIFRETLMTILPNIVQLLNSDLPLFDKVRQFTENYFDLFTEKPYMPMFILHELGRNPERIVDFISTSGIKPDLIVQQINNEIGEGKIKQVDPYHFIVNMLALCIFPFVASPIIKEILFENDETLFKEFIEQRRKEVPEFLIKAIKK